MILKKVSFDNLVIGKQYYVKCGIWQGRVSFVGTYQSGKRIKYHFTYGPAENWENQFGHICSKSQIKVYEIL